MDQALSIFNVNFFKENVQEDHPLYNNIFLSSYIIEITSELGYILPNSAKFIDLDIIKTKLIPLNIK